VRALTAGLAVILLVAGVAASLAFATSSTAPASKPRQAAAPACTPTLRAGTHRLPAIDGRVPVVVHMSGTIKPGAPLVLGLPGAGQTARDFATYTGYSRLADQQGFVVAYPTATGTRPFWNISGEQPGKPDDVDYLRRVIPAVLKATCADPARVGVTGVSNGGGMSARMACDAADLVAAAAPVAGGYGSLPDCHPARPVPMLEIHGWEDQVVPYNGKPPDGSGAVSAFLAQWRRLDACPRKQTRLTPRPNVVELRWGVCAGGTVVQHDRISDAEHGWPGEDDLTGAGGGFSSTRRTWDFLKSFRRPG
jgi:polyhydroxybutyrate depolymerase